MLIYNINNLWCQYMYVCVTNTFIVTVINMCACIKSNCKISKLKNKTLHNKIQKLHGVYFAMAFTEKHHLIVRCCTSAAIIIYNNNN